MKTNQMKNYLALFLFCVATVCCAQETPPGVIISHIPGNSGKYIGSPSICILPNGNYVASHDEFGPGSSEFQSAVTHIFHSSDQGANWKEISVIRGLFWSNLFVHNNALYNIGTNKHHGNVVIRKSTDGGETWTNPYNGKTGLLLEGEYHTAPMPMIVHDGRIWRAVEYATAPTIDWGKRYSSMVISAPVDADLLDTESWQKSNYLMFDPTWLDGKFGGWLEGNVVISPEGKILDILRVDVPTGSDEYAAMVEISEDGKKVSFNPETNFVKFPGGAKKFTIRYDLQSKRYWTIHNVVDEQYRDKKKPAGCRNILALSSSADLHTWQMHEILLQHPDVERHGFQYVDWLFEGDDIIYVSRTAFDDETGGARNFHDANFMTFHRIKDFRLTQNPDNRIVFFDAKKGSRVTEQGVTAELKNGELHVTTGLTNQWPGIVLQDNWQLPGSREMVLLVTNHDDRPLTLNCRLDSPRPSDDMRNTLTTSTTLAPGERKIWQYQLPSLMPDELKGKFFGMRGDPFGMQSRPDGTFDPQEISQLILFMDQSGIESHWSVEFIGAIPSKISNLAGISPDEFFPMIDKYGQFMHRDWPGKIHDDSELKKAFEVEQADLAANPSPGDRNKYGGWTAGPKLKATGHFRTEKLDGKWWLVDPEGCLFWSHGTDCVIVSNAATPITDREFYFSELPPREGPFASCYGTGNWSPHNYYEGRGTYQIFDFSKANIIRKYGENWAKTYNDLVHRRLRSWGMNTIANWSATQFYRMQRTPYTETLNIDAQEIHGSKGYWGKFIDPFDPQFRQTIQASARQAARTSGHDPWCIGYFVQNEISWGSETSLSLAALMSPADQPVKIAVSEYLRQKYEDIEKLNAVWHSQYEDWNDLLQSTEMPDERLAHDDMVECYRLIAECYFCVIKEELHAACPDKLYLGCRFAWGNKVAVTEAAKYCDVISFNEYKYDLDGFTLPEGIDKPCIIGEFHFGALDRGMFHTGLCPVESQEARAAAYEKYVRSALNNRYLVGTHWFQYMDQATTGRFDGENYQIGLLTLCDTPYPETIAAVRKIGNIMYEERYRGENK